MTVTHSRYIGRFPASIAAPGCVLDPASRRSSFHPAPRRSAPGHPGYHRVFGDHTHSPSRPPNLVSGPAGTSLSVPSQSCADDRPSTIRLRSPLFARRWCSRLIGQITTSLMRLSYVTSTRQSEHMLTPCRSVSGSCLGPTCLSRSSSRLHGPRRS